MITLEKNTFAWYGEQSTQGVYVCINSIIIVKLSKILVDSFAIVIISFAIVGRQIIL